MKILGRSWTGSTPTTRPAGTGWDPCCRSWGGPRLTRGCTGKPSRLVERSALPRIFIANIITAQLFNHFGLCNSDHVYFLIILMLLLIIYEYLKINCLNK